jgi:hypothetical protein
VYKRPPWRPNGLQLPSTNQTIWNEWNQYNSGAIVRKKATDI